MCGFVGLAWGVVREAPDLHPVARGVASTDHRGPDSGGTISVPFAHAESWRRSLTPGRPRPMVGSAAQRQGLDRAEVEALLPDRWKRSAWHALVRSRPSQTEHSDLMRSLGVDVERLHKALPIDSRLEVRYEALLEGPKEVLPEILPYLGDGSAAAKQAMPAASVSGHRNSIGRWRSCVLRYDAAVVESECGPTLHRLGHD